MERLGTLDEAIGKVLDDTRRCVGHIQELSAVPFETAEAGVNILQRLRSKIYEELNQIQHEHLIILAAKRLVEEGCPADIEWYWNPRQTGDYQEPDLRGMYNGAVIISAEITTSENPVGTIDSRMKNTLSKLAQAEGDKYYFVRSDPMYRRAKTKIARAGWPIKAVMLAAAQ